MDKPKLVPYADVSVVSGTYEKEGKTRNRYTKIGVMFASPGAVQALEGHRLSIKLDALPNGGDGWLSVFEREPKESGYEKAKAARDNLRVEPSNDFSLSDIPDFDN